MARPAARRGADRRRQPAALRDDRRLLQLVPHRPQAGAGRRVEGRRAGRPEERRRRDRSRRERLVIPGVAAVIERGQHHAVQVSPWMFKPF